MKVISFIVVAVLFFFAAYAGTTHAKYLASSEAITDDGSVVVLLSDEDCRYTEFVDNLPSKAWLVKMTGEDTEKYEGCYGAVKGGSHKNAVIFWFIDRNILILDKKQLSPIKEEPTK